MSKYLLLCFFLLVSCGPVEGFIESENKLNDNASQETSPKEGDSLLDTKIGVDVSLPIPKPEDLVKLTGMEASACSAEGSLISKRDAATSVAFKNSSDAAVTIYWLDFSGKRVKYKTLASGGTHTQQTYVTHPWLIANEKDQCMGIYTATSTSNVMLDIQESLVLAEGSVSGGSNLALSPVTSANLTEERVRQGISCLQAKGHKTEEYAVQGLLNVYLQFKVTLGEEIAKKGYLEATINPLNSKGC